MRGEDASAISVAVCPPGSPPHARGRLIGSHPIRVGRGITPACAGKTDRLPARTALRADHPRMRGEDFMLASAQPLAAGSPPHARGRLHEHTELTLAERITPACAGKTRWRKARSPPKRDHPRMRGEDSAAIRTAP